MRVKMFFKQPIFRAVSNTTVRRGVKWDVGEKEDIDIVDEKTNKVVVTVNISTRVKRLCDITELDVRDEHDPRCRTVEGLKDVLSKTYSGKSIDDTEIFTIVDFYIPSEIFDNLPSKYTE